MAPEVRLGAGCSLPEQRLAAPPAFFLQGTRGKPIPVVTGSSGNGCLSSTTNSLDAGRWRERQGSPQRASCLSAQCFFLPAPAACLIQRSFNDL